MAGSKLTFVTVVVLALAISTDAWWWWSNDEPEPAWNALRTTFAPDGYLNWLSFLNTKGFNALPRTLEEANKAKFVNVSSSCTNGGKFSGSRFVLRKDDGTTDVSVAVLLDVNGIIAGLQLNVNYTEAKANPNNTYKFDEIPMFVRNTIDGADVYTLTAYFVEPSTICTTGRTATDFENDGTGYQLAFQNGTSPDSLIVVPDNRTDALTQGWSDNKCFPGMGTHNWYKQEELQLTKCDYILPAFLLYNSDNLLIGWGFQFVGKSSARRCEAPPASVVERIVGPNVSACLIEKAQTDNVGVTTMHVYLIDNPAGLLCPLNNIG